MKRAEIKSQQQEWVMTQITWKRMNNNNNTTCHATGWPHEVARALFTHFYSLFSYNCRNMPSSTSNTLSQP